MSTSNDRCHTKRFRFARFLGECGFFRHEGLCGFEPKWWPHARVKYSDGQFSRPMGIGNACDYRDIFGGEVVPVSAYHRSDEEKV